MLNPNRNHSVHFGELRTYFAHRPQKKYPKGSIIFHQGDKFDGIYYVLSGFVRIYDIDNRGNKKLSMIMSRDNLFPNALIIQDNIINDYYWEAMTETVLARVDPAEVKNDIINNEKLRRELTIYNIKSLGILNGRVKSLLRTYANQRIPAVLSHLVECAGYTNERGEGCLEVVVSHQDIAALANVARETASIELKKLSNKHIIWYQGNKMLIDLAALAKLE